MPKPTVTIHHEPLCTMDEAARALRVSRNTLKRYIETGVLEASKVGGRWLIAMSAIQETLVRGKTPRPGEHPDLC